MKLEVPYHKQTTKLNCGPAALKMALEFLGESYSLKRLEEELRLDKGKGISTIKLAIAARNLGFKTEFFSKVLGINPENLKTDFYKKYTDLIQDSEAQRLIAEARKIGVKLYEKTLTLEEIIKNIREERIMIVLLDANLLSKKEKEGFRGHFVPVVGYGKSNIYIHYPSFYSTVSRAFLPIKKEIFDKARKAKGTDEDIIIIYKK
jgi:ABC-type bacteriocin/lantibiotic exporter with double-glycine peptidase domain